MPGYTCVCKRTFTAQNYYSLHQHSCAHNKKCLSGAMLTFKDFMSRRKKPRISNNSHNAACIDPMLNVPSVSTAQPNPRPVSQHQEATVSTCPLDSDEGQPAKEQVLDEVQDICLAQRRSRCKNRQMPKRYRDVLPQPPPTVPVEVQDQIPEPPACVVDADVRLSVARTVFRTPNNIFRLVRQYFTHKPPSHDPEEYVTLVDLSFILGTPEATGSPPELIESGSAQYDPYPNCASFQLGEWYWNQGVQKSQADYLKLADIVDGSSFQAADISSTHWRKINTKFGANDYDDGDIEEWEDEDAGWI
ncbi:hypothetical protein EV424DRAFT_1536486 [Suillus variegatus]|nr:hypothetical protein EV424DRAFT_1536486 [Suillus variegatus]